MPFASSRRPSIQLGLLQAIVKRAGFSATTHYFNLELGATIGWERYELLCHARDILLGEWLFSTAAFADEAPDPATYVERYKTDLRHVCSELGCDLQYLLELRSDLLPAFIDHCLDLADWQSSDVIAFSSIFEQNCAALALARRLKLHHPHLISLFGGANFEDEMGIEYVQSLPWIDYAVIGEGDHVLPELLDRLATGGDAGELVGVASRSASGSLCFSGRAAQVTELDQLPEPDYGDFFAATERHQLPPLLCGEVIALPFETARGCWWGEKHHCTFCGLNGLGMAFRRKSPKRVLFGIDELAYRYGTYALLSVDNILDHRYIAEVFVPLAAARNDYTFFFEAKANLTASQLRDLSAGGVRIIQPGLESLNTHVLSLMRKGTNRLQNIRFLKWGRYYGLIVTWNLLLGFPGERLADYHEQIQTISLIPHLFPPGYVGRIRLDRFSPNFFASDELGFTDIQPIDAYRHTYPTCLEHESIAYFFSYEAASTLRDDDYQETIDTVRRWQRAWDEPSLPYLLFQRGAGRLTITDGRYAGESAVTSFDEFDAQVYERCTTTAHSPKTARRLLAEGGTQTTLTRIEDSLAAFVDAGLMIEESGQFLGLALPVNGNW